MKKVLFILLAVEGIKELGINLKDYLKNE